ncbi:hypothetical protein K474DRAFT_1688223 [Panus rudis PR-1116 ss-1]|nr:hypothetical protein K474DRAFT_1688223 [Panus rudis PR-1116 ss-1]
MSTTITGAILEVQGAEQCKAMQQEEWEVLESIYPDYLSGDPSKGSMKLEIPIEFSQPRSIVSPENKLLASLSALPPLLLDIILPPNYPLYGPPEIIAIHATHSWLPPKIGLRHYLKEMWVLGEGVLYTWIEWIRGGDFLERLNLAANIDEDYAIRIPHPELDLLIPKLITYDSSMQLTRFSQNSYNCEICMTSIKGARCILLACSHVFCRSCLEDFWKLCIAEGEVGRVGCPDPQCVKEGKEANEEDVRRVVTEEEVRRWKWLRQKRAVERDPTIVHCPVSFCQTPVPMSKDVERDTSWERLRECPECGFSFCAYCKRTWHGPHSQCPLAVTDALTLKYIELPEGSPERVAMERRYGRANLQRLVAQYEEDKANQEWLKAQTTACPSCEVRVEKSHGCNHMTCLRCRHHFCYRCGEKISAQNPYTHFNIPGTPCYSKLFDVESIENEWQPIEAFDEL